LVLQDQDALRLEHLQRHEILDAVHRTARHAQRALLAVVLALVLGGTSQEVIVEPAVVVLLGLGHGVAPRGARDHTEDALRFEAVVGVHDARRVVVLATDRRHRHRADHRR